MSKNVWNLIVEGNFFFIAKAFLLNRRANTLVTLTRKTNKIERGIFEFPRILSFIIILPRLFLFLFSAFFLFFFLSFFHSFFLSFILSFSFLWIVFSRYPFAIFSSLRAIKAEFARADAIKLSLKRSASWPLARFYIFTSDLSRTSARDRSDIRTDTDVQSLR